MRTSTARAVVLGVETMSGSNEPLPNVVHTFEFAKSGLPTFKPFNFSMTEQLSMTYELMLRVTTSDASVDESKLVGEACTLTLTRAGLVRHINGVVAQASFSAISHNEHTPDGNLPTGVVTLQIVPALWALGQRSNYRIFQNVTVVDILKKVLKEGLDDYSRKATFKTTKTYQELEYCTQYGESDLAFVQRLMAREGIMSYFKQGSSVEELVLFDDADNYQKLVTMDHDKVPFETAFGDAQAVETVSLFSIDTRLTSTAASARALNWSSTTTPDDASAKGKDSLKRSRELYLGEAPVTLGALDGGGTYGKTSAAGQVKLVQESHLARKTLARGSSVVSGLSPGTTFELANALRTELNRKYLVVGTTHTGGQPEGSDGSAAFSANQGEVLYHNTFTCVPADVLFRLEPPPRRFAQATHTAIVVGDEDITTDVHGRIKVQFHWDREGKNDEHSSCWVRVAQASAGIGFGAVFIPRKGQEVVVTFLEGDPDRPLVIGSVYNGVNKPPYDLPGEKTRSVIRTQSTPDSSGYNELSFEDAKDSEELYIQAQKDMKELVKHDHTVLIKNDENLTVEKNQTEEIGVDQTLTVKGNRSRTVKKDEDVTVDGSREKTIGKDEEISVRGGRSATIGKDESLTVVGARDLSIGKNESLDVVGSRSTSVGGSDSLAIKKARDVSVGGALSTSITKDETRTVEKSRSTSIKENDSLEVTKALSVTGKEAIKLTQDKTSLTFSKNKVDLEAGDTVTIKQGGTTVTIKDGKVTIKTNDTITAEAGSSKVTISSSSVTIKGSSVGIN